MQVEDSQGVVKESLPHWLEVSRDIQRGHGTADDVPPIQGQIRIERSSEGCAHDNDVRIDRIDDVFATVNHSDVS